MDDANTGASQRTAYVLLVSSIPDDRLAFAQACDILGLRFASFQRWAHAMAAFRADAMSVVVCEQQMPDADWWKVAADVRSLGNRATFIVVADRVSGRLASEVRRAGGAGVLIRPLRLTTIDRVLEDARSGCASMAAM